MIAVGMEGNNINIEMENDGIGLDLTHIINLNSIGFKQIYSRVDHLNGVIEIDSKQEGSTTFFIHSEKISNTYT